MALNHFKLVATLVAAMVLTGGGFFAYRSYHPASEQSRGAESAPRKAGNPSGKMLVCQYNRFAVLKQDGSGLTPVGDELDEYEFIYRHRVSPDGKSVAFHHQTRVGMVLSLWKFDEPWPGQVLRTEQSHDFFWMPDGKHLVQCRYKSIEDNFPADFEFQTLDVATRKVASVPLPEGHWLSDISRDGKWFLTVKSDPKNVDTGGPLYRVDRATGKARMLFDKEMLVVPPLWWRISPDGTQVAGMKVYGARRLQLAVGDVAAGTFRQVTREDHHVSLFGGWSPDGKKLLYSFSDAPAKPKADEPYQDSFVTIDTDGGNRAELYRKKRRFNAQGQRQVMDSVGWADWR